jgi:hypothetical protein
MLKSSSDDINQTYCLYATGGHLWMRDYYDVLPPVVRQRLCNSPFNLCAWCLQIEMLPGVRRKHPNWSKEKLLFAAIEVMEALVRRGDIKPTSAPPVRQPRRRSR